MTKLRIGLCSVLILPRIPLDGPPGEPIPLTFIQAALELSADAFPRHRVAHLVLLVVERGSSSISSKSLPENLPAAAAPTRQASAKRSKAHSLSCLRWMMFPPILLFRVQSISKIESKDANRR
jgi:hypothetical protein